MTESKSMAENIITDFFPVSIVMECSEVCHGNLTFPSWKVAEIIAGENIGQRERHCTVIHEKDGREKYIWSGYSVKLYKDGAESYWYNLVGKNPLLFVICQEDDEHGMAPLYVSANYDDANACMEVDGTVYSVPVPQVIYQWLEEYVVTYYKPEEPKKRQREKWSKEGQGGQRK